MSEDKCECGAEYPDKPHMHWCKALYWPGLPAELPETSKCLPESGKPREWVIDDAYDLVAGPHPGKETLAAKHEELLSYLPKVPTQPYEKELVCRAKTYEETNRELREQLDAVVKERDELAKFKQQWEERDGNSPGYNRDKARNYGDQAFKYKTEAEKLQAENAELRAELESLKRQCADQMSGCCDCSMYKAARNQLESANWCADRYKAALEWIKRNPDHHEFQWEAGEIAREALEKK